jgi:hypothetical protein
VPRGCIVEAHARQELNMACVRLDVQRTGEPDVLCAIHSPAQSNNLQKRMKQQGYTTIVHA